MNDLAAGSMLSVEEASRAASESVCRLELLVDDPLIVPELIARPEGPDRDGYALTALRIGVLALKQAQGRLDGDVIRSESDRLLGMLEERLGSHQRTVQGEVAATLREYFDPKSGRFNERVEQLVKSGGELERLLRGQIGASDSELAKTLDAHVGAALETQRETLLSQFSLDNGDGALARLVKELTAKHGELAKELEQLIEKSNRENDEFRVHVRATLAALQARREESLKSTRHGLDFEQAMYAFVADGARGAGDVAEHTAGTTGLIKNCKVGDVVLTLGPEHAAAGGRIAIEAKEDASYSLKDALEESEQARKNRGAEVGVFVFSRRAAGEQIAPLARYGQDVGLVWDREDSATDVVLAAGLSLARALCVGAGAERENIDVDLERMQKAMLDVEKQVQGLDEIRRHADSIRSCAGKIDDRARIMGDNISRAMRVLGEETEAISAALAGDGD